MGEGEQSRHEAMVGWLTTDQVVQQRATRIVEIGQAAAKGHPQVRGLTWVNSNQVCATTQTTAGASGEVRGHARAIHDLSKELEPTDDDETMARERTLPGRCKARQKSWCPGKCGQGAWRRAHWRLSCPVRAPGQPDLTGDYFTPDTDYGDAKTADVYYNHGMDASLGLRRLGKTDLRTDDAGVWAETQLALRDA